MQAPSLATNEQHFVNTENNGTEKKLTLHFLYG